MQLLSDSPVWSRPPNLCGGDRLCNWPASRPLLSALLLLVMVTLLTNAKARAEPEFRLAGVNYLGDLPTLVADQHGLFGEEGIAVSVDYGFSGKENLERLRSGETDFALMALTPLVIDYLRDPTPGEPSDPVIIANLVHADDLNQLVTLKRVDLQSPADWRGKRVGMMKGTNAEFFWWQYMIYHGLDAAAITMIDLPTSQLPAALLEGNIDAALLWEPWTSQLLERLGDELRVFDTSDVYTAKWILVMRREMSVKEPEALQALLRAYIGATKWIEGEPDAAMRMYSEQAGVTLKTVQDRWIKLHYQAVLNWSLLVSLQQHFEWARQAGYYSGARTRGVLGMIDATPLASIAPTAVTIPHVSGTARQ